MKGKLAKKNERTAYIFCIPWYIGFLAFTIVPIVYMLYFSLTDRKLNGLSEFIGFKNYQNIFSSSVFWNSLRVTLFYTLVSVVVTAIWALFLALLLNKKQKLQGAFQFFYFIPSVIPSVALAYSFRTIFGKDSGLLNGILSNFAGKSVSVNWLYNPQTVYFAVFAVTLFTYSTGQMMMIFRNGLNVVPKELYESAELDGANAVSKFFHVTLPMISPIFLFNIITSVIGALNGSFALLFPLASENGDPNGMTQVLSLLIYKESFSNMRVGYASALSFILFVVAALIGIIIFALSKKFVYYEN